MTLKFFEVCVRFFSFAFEGIADERTGRVAANDIRSEFNRASFVEDLVLVSVDDGRITGRHGVEGAIGKKLVDDFTSLATRLRDDGALPLALDTISAAGAG